MNTRIQIEITGLHRRLDGLRDETLKVLGSLEMLRKLHREKSKKSDRKCMHNLEMRALNISDMLEADKGHADARIALEKQS